MNMTIKAAKFADEAHKGQMRKYGYNIPYIIHPGRVAARVSLVPNITEDEVAAAWLHDVLEDTSVTEEYLSEVFNSNVVSLVVAMTNPSKDFPEFNRAERKAMDRGHLAKATRQVRIIKMADRIDNLRDMVNAPSDFLKLYHKESSALFEVICGADQRLASDFIYALDSVNRIILGV